MNNVNKTLYIPLYGKFYVSRKGIILSDKKAEEIWAAEGFELKGKSASKWVAYYMGMRSKVFDNWLASKIQNTEELSKKLEELAQLLKEGMITKDEYNTKRAEALMNVASKK